MKWIILLVACLIAAVNAEDVDKQPQQESNVDDHPAVKPDVNVIQIEDPAVLRGIENNVDSDGYVEIKNIGYYKVYDDKATWHEALGQCYVQGGHLAVINTPQEAHVLKKLMKEHNIPYCAHIGFSDLMKSGYFVTLDGEPINHEGYTRWEGGIPGSGYRCGAMTPAGELANRNCEEKLPFICEKDITSTWVKNSKLGSKYFLNREVVSWGEALKKCHMSGATLAVVNSEEEAEFLSIMLMKDMFLVHVGVHDKYAEAFYTTVDGVKIDHSGYSKWVPMQPIKHYNFNTVAMTNRGLYALMPESARLPFICEKHL